LSEIKPKQNSFEAKLAKLEEIAKNLEDEQISLSDALAIYESGVKLSRQCQSELQDAEQRIKTIQNHSNEED